MSNIITQQDNNNNPNIRRFFEGQVIVNILENSFGQFSITMPGADVILKMTDRFRAATKEESDRFHNRNNGGSGGGNGQYGGMIDVTDNLQKAMEIHKKMMSDNKRADQEWMQFILNGGSGENKLTSEQTYRDYLKMIGR